MSTPEELKEKLPELQRGEVVQLQVTFFFFFPRVFFEARQSLFLSPTKSCFFCVLIPRPPPPPPGGFATAFPFKHTPNLGSSVHMLGPGGPEAPTKIAALGVSERISLCKAVLSMTCRLLKLSLSQNWGIPKWSGFLLVSLYGHPEGYPQQQFQQIWVCRFNGYFGTASKGGFFCCVPIKPPQNGFPKVNVWCKYLPGSHNAASANPI